MEHYIILTFFLMLTIVAGILTDNLKTASFIFLLLLMGGFFQFNFYPSPTTGPIVMDDYFLNRAIACNIVLFFLWFLTNLILLANLFFFLKDLIYWLRVSYIVYSQFFSSIFLVLSLFICVVFVFPIVINANTLDLLLFCFVDAVKCDTIPSGIGFNDFFSVLNQKSDNELAKFPVMDLDIGGAPTAFVIKGDEGYACTQYGKFFSDKWDDGTLVGKIKVFIASSSLKLTGYDPEYTCVKLPSQLLKELSNCESCKK